MELVQRHAEQANGRERGGHRAEPQTSLELAAQRAEVTGQALDIGENPLRALEDQLALGRQALEPSPAPDERGGELELEPLDAGR